MQLCWKYPVFTNMLQSCIWYVSEIVSLHWLLDSLYWFYWLACHLILILLHSYVLLYSHISLYLFDYLSIHLSSYLVIMFVHLWNCPENRISVWLDHAPTCIRTKSHKQICHCFNVPVCICDILMCICRLLRPSGSFIVRSVCGACIQCVCVSCACRRLGTSCFLI